MPLMSLSLSSTSDVITFDQNWCHLYSISARGKDDTQIRGIGSITPEICSKMLKNLSEKLRAKFPATTSTDARDGYSMPKVAQLGDALSDVFELETNPVEDQSLQ